MAIRSWQMYSSYNEVPGVLIGRENRATPGEKPCDDGGDMEEPQCKPRTWGPPGAGRGIGGSLAGRTVRKYFLFVRVTQFVAHCTAAQANGYRFASSHFPASFLMPSAVSARLNSALFRETRPLEARPSGPATPPRTWQCEVGTSEALSVLTADWQMLHTQGAWTHRPSSL